jgi:hypothetical protein
VWVVVTFDESSVGALSVWRRAEIFQPGQLSRWEHTTEEQVPLEDALRDGLSRIRLGGDSCRRGGSCQCRLTCVGDIDRMDSRWPLKLVRIQALSRLLTMGNASSTD